MEMERNRERFQFLKWGAKAFRNMLIVPPGSGIVHQVRPSYQCGVCVVCVVCSVCSECVVCVV